jgi:hypothetical protein
MLQRAFCQFWAATALIQINDRQLVWPNKQSFHWGCDLKDWGDA